LQRPVERYLETATVKEFKYDLFQDLPEGIGDRFSNGICFSEKDIGSVLSAISESIQSEKSPEENVIFDVVIKGKWYGMYWLAGIISASMVMWDDVRQLKFANLDGVTWVMFPREF
jgi:hypothetical protein